MESVLASHNLHDCNERVALAILFDRFGHFLTNHYGRGKILEC
jgi:hypothetical protein